MTIFRYSRKTEALRLLFTAKKLATNQYQDRGYLILPQKPAQPAANLVIFPDLPYYSILKFWHRVMAVRQTTPPLTPQPLLQETMKLIEFNQAEANSKRKKLANSWQKISPAFRQNLFEIIPAAKKQVKQLTVFLSRYGTPASFNLITPRNSRLNIFLRLDQPLTSLMERIISGITRYPLQQQHFNWPETEAAKDCLILQTKLRRFFPHYRSTITDSRSRQQPQLKQTSRQYLAKLGLANNPQWNSKKILYLTSLERKLLDILINCYPDAASFDQLQTALWPENLNIGLSALTKLIQRLRLKFTKNRLAPNLIQAQRKRGYLLAGFSAAKNSISEAIF